MLGRVGSSSEASWKKIAAHVLSLNTNTKGPQQQPPEASSLYFSLLIGYRVQALNSGQIERGASEICSESGHRGRTLRGRPGWELRGPHSLPTHSALSPSHPGDPAGGGGLGKRKTTRPAELRFWTWQRHLWQPRLSRAVKTAKEGICTTRAQQAVLGPLGLACHWASPLLKIRHTPVPQQGLGIGALGSQLPEGLVYLGFLVQRSPWVSPTRPKLGSLIQDGAQGAVPSSAT